MKYLFLSLIAALMLLGGCGVWDSTAKYTKESWETTRDFVDPPPEIDTDSYQFSNPNQEKLAKLISPVDGPLTSLIRFVDNTDTLPGVDWLDLLRARFPWVNRVLVTDEHGTIMFMQPELPVKKISKPLVFEGVWRQIKLLTVVDYSDLGAELYLGRPYFEDVTFRGLIGVGFDPRSLLRLSPAPEELIIIHPGKGVWSLGADVDEEAILAVQWEEILKKKVEGQVKVGNRYYTWLTRYVGEDQYVYATQSADPNAEGSWWPF
ncbi:hypothetical protein GO013_09980 [Pseudodesulfovibrio sp. JC047]|uniref:hypothetical protein n=1 Tax=Pseudodesulfovibrio sp. JC047 TaxID=2683199 RepID=UPI0013D29533|nr:hypothetical protein [Pseudodesulfovibrio sp. JC047]NDV19747.1 hypothetical protein [Pseudodesulfovibrio sp. JC047]